MTSLRQLQRKHIMEFQASLILLLCANQLKAFHNQWRIEHKCRQGRRPQTAPFQEFFYLSRKKMSTNTPKFLTTFFRLPNCAAPSAAPLTCAAPNFQLVFRIYQKCHLFDVNLNIFYVNLNISYVNLKIFT